MSGLDKKIKHRKKKNKKGKKSPTDNVASLYKEDIGFEGVKKRRMLLTNDNIGPFELPVNEKEESKRQKRMERFVKHSDKSLGGKRNRRHKEQFPDWSSSSISNKKSNDVKRENPYGLLSDKKLVGINTSLEKPYMRLTTFPKAIDVRPLPVLKKALAHIKVHYINNEDFDFANEQLKSLRQDIIVQHLRNNFVVEVYETHSRILLEHGDLNEFNQCQTMIRSLTGPNSLDETNGTIMNGIQKKNLNNDRNDSIRQSDEATDEFQAYSLIYNVVQNSWCDLTVGFSLIKKRNEIKDIESGLSTQSLPPIAQGSSVLHALNVVKAIIHDDYLAFFRLYESAPHMSAYLMDYLVRRVRNVAYGRTIAAYRPSISTEHFREVLKFRDLEETRTYLKEKGAIFLNDSDNLPFWVDCKATHALFQEDGN